MDLASHQHPTLRFLKAFIHPRTISSSSSSPRSDLTPPPTLDTKQEPPWLTKFLTDKSYRARVLRVLAERERCRAAYRSIPEANRPTPSRSKSPPSQTSSKEVLSASYYSTFNASSSENRSHNRYFDVLPYDRCAVSVDLYPSNDKDPSPGGNSAYLNASWVKENSGDIWWVAAQAPLPHTIPIFLAQCTPLVPAAQRPRVIVQLTATIEAGRRKAHEYLPREIGEGGRILYPLPSTASKQPIGNTENFLEVVLTERHDIPEAKAVQSSILLTFCAIVRGSGGSQKEERGETMRVVHFYYAAWPDFGVPTELMTILNLAKVVEATNASSQPVSTPSLESKDQEFSKKTENTVNASVGAGVGGGHGGRPPILVHCSAGVGRTGTFIALTSVLRQLGVFGEYVRPKADLLEQTPPLGALPSQFAGDMIMTEIDMLREYRCMMVQRSEQIMFVYNALRQALNIGA